MRITLKNNLRVLSFHIVGTILMFLCLWYFKFADEAILIFGCFWVLYTLPAFYLHIEYYLKNRGEAIEINPNEIIVRRNGKEIKRYSSNELEEISVYKSASLDRGGIQILALESYHYARILTKTKEEIIITCLLTPKVEEAVKQLRGVEYFRYKVFFATLKLKW